MANAGAGTNSTKSNTRAGICCAGNWIIDHVKVINTWPAEETLASIIAEEDGTGGSPYNVCIDLARFGATFPLFALGLVGDDEDGATIRRQMEDLHVDTRFLRTIPGVPTAYTDVFTVEGTGRRTFFHQRGANALLGPEHFPVVNLRCRILTLGYLLLLDALDAPDDEFGTAAARVLAVCRDEGIRTAVDLVSEDSGRFASVVKPVLPHTDYLVINEVEAGRTTGRRVRADGGELNRDALEATAGELLAGGVGELVVLHAPEGALAFSKRGEQVWQPSLRLPKGFIKGGAGAGDAFFAGVMFGLHEGWELSRTLKFAHGAAATCLRHPTCTGGVGNATEIEELSEQLGWRA